VGEQLIGDATGIRK